MITASGTSSPASMSRRASSPSFVPWATASRSMSPVAIWGTLQRAASRRACVPFPAPGGPSSTTRISGADLRAASEEPLVVPHQEVRLHLPHRVEGDADDDEETRAAEVEGHVEGAYQEVR